MRAAFLSKLIKGKFAVCLV